MVQCRIAFEHAATHPSLFLQRSAALFIMFALYAWFAADPSPLLTNVPFTGAVAVFGLASIITFALPLLTLHELLAHEKRRLQDENGGQIENIVAELHRRVKVGELAQADKIQALMNSLVAEREVLVKLRTWPWETDTARLVLLTAMLLPMLLWIIQRTLQGLGF